MTDLFLERVFDPALTPDEVVSMAFESGDCFGMHQVAWRGSHLSLDGRKMVCWFSAPDLESARIALRKVDTDSQMLWRGTVHDARGVDEASLQSASVLVERSFEDPVTIEEIQDIEDAGIGCLEMRKVRFMRSFFSRDRKRMICLYAAPDAESVRQAQREAGVPFDEVWAFRAVGP